MKNEHIRDEYLKERKLRRKKAKQRRFIACFVIFLVIALITFVILSLTVLFPISKITASGSKIYTNDQIVVNSGIKIGDNIFTFGEKNAVKLLKSKLPFVEKVEFKRSLPDGVHIKVTDAKPYYCILLNGEYYNISKAGWVLEKVTEKTEGVFEIKISKVKCTVGTAMVFNDTKTKRLLDNTIEILEENEFDIDYVDVTNTITVKAGICGRFDVNFGTENSLENKVKHLKTTIENLEENKSGSINLSMWNDQKPMCTFVENNTK